MIYYTCLQHKHEKPLFSNIANDTFVWTANRDFVRMWSSMFAESLPPEKQGSGLAWPSGLTTIVVFAVWATL